MYWDTSFCLEDDSERFFLWYGISIFKIGIFKFYDGRSRFSGKLRAGMRNSWFCKMEQTVCFKTFFWWRDTESGRIKNSFYGRSERSKDWIKAQGKYRKTQAYLFVWISGNAWCRRKDGKETRDVWRRRKSDSGSNLCESIWSGHWSVRTDGRNFRGGKAFLWWFLKCSWKWIGRNADWSDSAKSWSDCDRGYETNKDRGSKDPIFLRCQWRCDSSCKWWRRSSQWLSKRDSSKLRDRSCTGSKRVCIYGTVLFISYSVKTNWPLVCIVSHDGSSRK